MAAARSAQAGRQYHRRRGGDRDDSPSMFGAAMRVPSIRCIHGVDGNSVGMVYR